MRAGAAFDITARLAGAVVAYIAVAIVLLSRRSCSGLIVLVGVPMLVLVIGTVIRPLQRRQGDQRHEVGALTALGADTAAGLRVLRGIGGEQAFFDRYRRQSQDVRLAGVRVATPQSTLDAAQVFVPGLFVVLVTWIGARFALDGKIGTGELVAFYGYAAFLVIPLRTAAEAVDKMTRSLVGARRMLDVLAIEPDVRDPAQPARSRRPACRSATRSRGSSSSRAAHRAGLVRAARDGRARRPDRALRRRRRRPRRRPPGRPARRDRPPPHRRQRGRPRPVLGRAAPGARPVAARRRRRRGRRRSRWRTPRTSSMRSPSGSTRSIDERGRSFSGGQRQRLALTRALLADPEILVLVEPTSAVDAHTEARIARRLREARSGQTTVVVTASPLVLDRADRVVLVEDGRVTATGGHRELLRENARYREIVTRGGRDERAAAHRRGPRAARAGTAARPEPPRRTRRRDRPERSRRGRGSRRPGAARRARAVGAGRDDGEPRRQARRPRSPRSCSSQTIVTWFARRASFVLSSRSSPSCARTSCGGCWRCRSRPSSAPAPATSSRGRRPTSTRSRGRSASPSPRS